MGLSENSVPLNPVNDYYPLNGYFIGNIPNIFRQTQMGNDGNSIETAQTSPATPVLGLGRGAAAPRAVEGGDGGEAASDIR